LSNTTGYENTATGAFALTGNTTGFQNTAHGANALSYIPPAVATWPSVIWRSFAI
jgi:hypothetical protein